MRQTRLALATLVIGIVFGASGGGALAQTPNENATDFVRRGNQEYAKANYKLAIAEYRRVPSNARETYAQALYNIGVCNYELWKTEDAVVYYRRAIAASSRRYPVALHALGVALKTLGK